MHLSTLTPLIYPFCCEIQENYNSTPEIYSLLPFHRKKMTEYKITKFSFADFRRKTLRELTPHNMENLDNRTFINKVIVLATCDLDSIFKENSPYQILKARTEIDSEDIEFFRESFQKILKHQEPKEVWERTPLKVKLVS